MIISFISLIDVDSLSLSSSLASSSISTQFSSLLFFFCLSRLKYHRKSTSVRNMSRPLNHRYTMTLGGTSRRLPSCCAVGGVHGPQTAVVDRTITNFLGSCAYRIAPGSIARSMEGGVHSRMIIERSIIIMIDLSVFKWYWIPRGTAQPPRNTPPLMSYLSSFLSLPLCSRFAFRTSIDSFIVMPSTARRPLPPTSVTTSPKPSMSTS
jgi:hypothetical protein